MAGRRSRKGIRPKTHERSTSYGSAPAPGLAVQTIRDAWGDGIRLEVTSNLDGDEEDLQVIRSCSMTKAELRAELETISGDRAWIDEMAAAMGTG
jgi:hypothetical protein